MSDTETTDEISHDVLMQWMHPQHMQNPNVRATVEQHLPMYPLNSPGMPPPGINFIRAAMAMGDEQPTFEGAGKKAILRTHGPWLEYLYRRALYDEQFRINVALGAGVASAALVPGHVYGAPAGSGESGPLGTPGVRVMLVGKNPGMDEVAHQRNFVGPSSGDLFRALDELGCSEMDRVHWYITNAVKWPTVDPAADRVPEQHFVDCAILLEQELRLYRPDFILCLGADAVRSVLGAKCTISSLTGRFIDKPICTTGPGEVPVYHVAKVMGCAHPASVFRRPETYDEFCQQVGQFLQLIRGTDIGAAEHDVRHTNIYTLEHLRAVVDQISVSRTMPVIAVDAEWHGAAPSEPGAYLRTIQFSARDKEAFSIVLRHQGGEQAFHPTIESVVPELNRLLKYDPSREYYPRIGGHFFRADLPWLVDFGVDVRREYAPAPSPSDCRFMGGWDTSLMYHAWHETAMFGLMEAVCRLTTAPRYDLPLEAWKVRYCKANKLKAKTMDGYGMCPDEVLNPEPWQKTPHYGCLNQDSLVQRSDGVWEKISSLVKRRYAGSVKATTGGLVVDAQVTGWHRADVGQKDWFKLRTASSKNGRHGLLGPVLTPDHKILTRRGQRRVDQLVPGVDAIHTDEREFSSQQLSVFLGSLLGDGGFQRPNSAGVGFGFGQRESKVAYLEWKAAVFATHSPAKRDRLRGARYELPCGRYLASLATRFPTHPVEVHAHRKVRVTADLLENLGLLGLAVWYQDDGTRVKTTSRIYAKMSAAEVTLVLTWLANQFGEEVSYNWRFGFFQFAGKSLVAFHTAVQPWMHPDMAYKSLDTLPVVAAPTVATAGGVFYETITEVQPYTPPAGRRGYGVRYCLTVKGARNFLTPAGFVSNCYDADVTRRLAIHFMGPKGLDRDYLGNECWTAFWTAHRASLGFLEMETNGLMVDRDRVDKLTVQYMTCRKKLLESFRKRINWPADADGNGGFNPNSVAHVVGLLFGLEYLKPRDRERVRRQMPPEVQPLGLVPVKSTGKRSKRWVDIVARGEREKYNPSTDKESLGILGHQHDLAMQLRDLKFIGQIIKTVLRPPVESEEEGEEFLTDDDDHFLYEEGLAGCMRSTGVVHTRLSQCKETGRASSYSPNLQAISSRREDDYGRILGKINKKSGLAEGDYLDLFEGPLYSHPIRSIFRARPGHFLVEVDYTGAELAVLGWMAQDPFLIEHVRRNSLPENHPDHYDIHSQTAVKVFQLPCPPTKKGLADAGFKGMRTAAKNVIFGIPYGRAADAISRQCREEGVTITPEKTQEIIDFYFQQYTRVGGFLQACQQRSQAPYHCLCNSFRRWRRFGKTWDRTVVSEQQRQAQNSPIQGSVADAVNVAIYNLMQYRAETGMAFRMSLQIHDALLFEVPHAEVRRFVVDEPDRPSVIRECMVNRNPFTPLFLDGTPIPNVGPYYFGYDFKVCVNWGEGVTKAQLDECGVSLEKSIA